MRLLCLKDHGTPHLTEFLHEPPSYAILSHTWGNDEVTFKDIQEGTAKTKAGYDKIRFCGKTAASHGLDFFWVDTCCIDKSNSTELQEAINSMYRWYRDATRCYVYLSDVSVLNGNESNFSSPPLWQSAFLASRWFTRGWTLQELLAPTSVEFFSQDGQRIGDKRSLEQQIHKRTGIAIQALNGTPLCEFSVDERFKWAETRKTTREEDWAYSLFGIFDIDMRLSYGEGREKAVARLKRKIDKNLKQKDAYHCPEAPLPAWIVPFEQNRRFVGRVSELATLEEMLSQDGTVKAAITGLGGVGKTQLALMLVYRTRAKYKDCSVIWMPASNLESLEQAYLNLAKHLNIVGCDNKVDNKVDIKRLVQDRLSSESTGRWLLVFDNADDVDMWTSQREQGSSQLIDYLPRSPQGSIVFTTRNYKMATQLAGRNIVELLQMDELAATQLLQEYLVNQSLINSQQDKEALLAQLTYLPLAIVQAAAYINANQITLGDYLLLLKEREEDVIELLSEEFEDDWRYRNSKNAVAVTWLISFNQMRQRDPLAADYLSFVACIHPKDIPLSLLPPGPSRKKEVDAKGTLNAYYFITKRTADQAIDVHQLVHLATRNWLQKEESLASWTSRVIARLAEVFAGSGHHNRVFWRLYLPHALCVLESDLVDKDGQDRVNLLAECGLCLYLDGRYNEAEQLEIQVMESRKTVLGPEHPDTLTSMANLASTFRNQGRWTEAEQLEIQVMELRKTVLGPEHPDTLTSMANLASTFRNQGRWKEAEQLDIQVMETSKTVLGPEHPDTLTSMCNLSYTLKGLGRYSEALSMLETCVQLQNQQLGPSHPDAISASAALEAWRVEVLTRGTTQEGEKE
ncbi:hypothetical protein MAP00_004217 [Monascus purpureus]|nr:hypothetical protein MAP00_004217 [Monascus purpureus]